MTPPRSCSVPSAWQLNELQLALNRQAREGYKFPVIPVLLNGFDVERTPLGLIGFALAGTAWPAGSSGARPADDRPTDYGDSLLNPYFHSDLLLT